MSTALDIITDAFQRARVYAANETVTDADAERALNILNDMLDSWSNESLACYAILEQSVALVANKLSYTIGTSGSPDINATRPLRLLDGEGAAFVQDSSGNNFPLEVIPRDKWNTIWNRTTTVNSNIPQAVFYDPTFPNGTLNFWPVENIGGYTAFWNSYLQLTTFALLSTSVSLPPGYKLALESNLAVDIWNEYKDKDPPGRLVMTAQISKGNVKRTNMRPNVAVYDPEILSSSVKTYNYKTDSTY